jgi:membrane-associated phospholipid phosphatase
MQILTKKGDVIGGAVLGITVALFITLLVGKVLWEYEKEFGEATYNDFDLKQSI